MFNDGNGFHGRNGSHRWWQRWKRDGESQRDLDLSSYRRLAVQLHHGLPRATHVSRSALVVTPNEMGYWAKGCVTLASCMAEELHQPVLLADAYDDAEVCRMLESSPCPGLADFLLHPRQPVEKLAMKTSQSNLWFLPNGATKGSALPSSSEHAKDLLVEAARHWDFVVLAGGPVLRNSLALSMAPYVGRILLLVTENQTQIEDIDAAQNALEQCGADNVCLVLTEPDEAVR